MKKKNRGLTLIELVVTIAIIAIFSGVVLAVISTGSSGYRSTYGNAKVQMETQETIDQIQNLLIDANRSIFYGSGEDLDNLAAIANDMDGGLRDMDKSLILCSATERSAATEDYVWDIITWDADEQKLFCSSREKENVPKYGEPDAAEGEPESGPFMGGSTETVAPAILAENVADFQADVTEVEKKRIVRFRITTGKNGKEITTQHTVNLRNQIKVQKPGSLSPLPSSNARIRILNVPQKLTSEMGSFVFDKYMVGDILPETVRWTAAGVNGCSFAQEDHSYGKLIIASDCENGMLEVRVTAATSAGQTVSDSVMIPVERIRHMRGFSASTGSVTLGVGNVYDLNTLVQFSVTYDDGSTDLIPASSVAWSGSVGGAPVSEEGQVSVPDGLGNSTVDSRYGASAAVSMDGSATTFRIALNIARVDLVRPSGTYGVGETKILEYVYKVGGVVSGTAGSLVVSGVDGTDTAGKTMSYNGDGTQSFSVDEVGEWNAGITVPVGTDGKTVSSERLFRVENRAPSFT